MRVENQVCTLEQAAKLAALGVRQSSLFYHAINSYKKEVKEITMHPDNRDIVYSAFTVAELGVMLQYIGVYTAVNTVMGGWGVYHVNGYEEFELPQPGNFNNEKYEAHARAHILIHLLENNLIKIEEVNQSLK